MGDVQQISHCEQCGLPLFPRKNVLGRGAVLDRYCCYACYLTHTLVGARGEEGTRTLLLARLGFSAFLAVNAMTFTWALYGKDLPIFFPVDESTATGLSYLIFVLSVPVFILIGIPYLKSALFQVRNLSIGVDTLIALGTTSAFVVSVVSTFTGGSNIYYDTATMVLVLVTFGRYLESTARLKTSRALEELLEKQPLRARVMKGEQEEMTDVSRIQPGDLIKILPGEKVPIDGRIVEGESSVDESVLTGEPRPLHKKLGDRALGGTTNYDGYILVEATSPADETVLSQIIRLVRDAQATRSPIQETADKLSMIFVPLVLGLSVLTFVVWTVHAGAAAGLLTAMSVLLISCPCGLGIGVALAASIGISRAARNGILVRSFSVLESLAKTGSLFFDKTGTLTFGRFKVEKILMAVRSQLTEDQAVALAASLEAHSEHAVGVAIKSLAGERGLALFPVRCSKVTPGVGIQGVIDGPGGGGIIVEVSKEILGDRTDIYCEDMDINPIYTGSYLRLDKLIQAAFIVRDSIRPEAAKAIRALRRLKVSTGIISGDRHATVEAVAAELGVEQFHSGLLPEEKIEVIKRGRKGVGSIVMVGDGINDAPALASADVGIAIGSSTDIAKQASDITIMDTDLMKVPWIIELARRTMRTIRWNLVWAFSYNVVGIGLAGAGMLKPIHAALAMVVSSTLVILNSSRLAGKVSENYRSPG